MFWFSIIYFVVVVVVVLNNKMRISCIFHANGEWDSIKYTAHVFTPLIGKKRRKKNVLSAEE